MLHACQPSLTSNWNVCQNVFSSTYNDAILAANGIGFNLWQPVTVRNSERAARPAARERRGSGIRLAGAGSGPGIGAGQHRPQRASPRVSPRTHAPGSRNFRPGRARSPAGLRHARNVLWSEPARATAACPLYGPEHEPLQPCRPSEPFLLYGQGRRPGGRGYIMAGLEGLHDRRACRRRRAVPCGPRVSAQQNKGSVVISFYDIDNTGYPAP